MKMFIKSSMVVVIASAAMISCIDDAVSPEVQQLRAGQVSLLTAQTSLATANAAYRQAEADSKKESVRTDKANADIAEAQALTTIKLAEQALQEATDDLAEYLDTHNLSLAGDYLDAFQDANDEIGELLIERVGKQRDIAVVKYYLSGTSVDGSGTVTPGTAGETLDLLKGEIERDLAKEQAKLDAQVTALATLQAVAADPAAAQAQLNAVRAEIADRNNKKLQFTVDLAKSAQAVQIAHNKVMAALDTISSYDQLVSDLSANATAITAQQLLITNQTKVVADLNTELTTKKAQLAPYTAELATRKAAFDTKNAQAIALENTLIIEESKLAAAQVNNPAASTTARDNAKTAFEAQVGAGGSVAFPNAGSPLELVKTPYEDIKDQFDPGMPADVLSDAVAMLGDTDPSAVGSVAEAQADLAALSTTPLTGLSALNVAKADLEAKKAALETANTAARADLQSLQAAEQAAVSAKDPIDDANEANDAFITQLTSVEGSLDVYINGDPIASTAGINGEIEAKKDEIFTTSKAVAAFQKDLADNAIDKTEADAYVARLEADLANINAEIAIQTAIAAKNKALLDAAIAG